MLSLRPRVDPTTDPAYRATQASIALKKSPQTENSRQPPQLSQNNMPSQDNTASRHSQPSRHGPAKPGNPYSQPPEASGPAIEKTDRLFINA